MGLSMDKKIWIGVLLSLLVTIMLLLAGWYQSDRKVETLWQQYATPNSNWMEILGLPVHYSIDGKGEDTLVLLHGTASSLHTWNGWVDQLQDDFVLVRMDLPAFGLTGPHPERDYSYDFYVEFLEQLATALSMKQFHLAGNSLGGAIAWHYTGKHPDRVKKLVLLNSSGLPTEQKTTTPFIFRLARYEITASVLRWITPRFFIANNLKEVYHQDSLITSALIDRYYDLQLRKGNRQAFIDRSNQFQQADTSRLSGIKSPVLIIWGRHDQWIPVTDGKRFQKIIPQAQLTIFENAGHVPMEEIPGPTSAAVRAFLISESTTDQLQD
jgi:pimeloyl-ACP methyl ester carboxylesterase